MAETASAAAEIAPSIIGAAGSLGSTLLGGSMNSASSAEAFRRSEQAASTAWQRQMWLAQHKHQMETWDLRRAGLNPILAASGGFSPGSTSAPMAQVQQTHPFPTTDIAGSAKDMATAATEGERKKLVKNQAKTELKKAITERARAGVMTATEKNLGQEFFNLEQKFQILTSEIDLTKGFVKLNEEEQRRVKLVVEAMNQNLERLKKMHDVYKGPAGSYIAYLNSLFGTVNIGMTGAASMNHLLRR